MTFKPYDVGTHKNSLIETILLSTHNIAFKWVIREILCGKYHFAPPYLDLWEMLFLIWKPNIYQMSHVTQRNTYWTFGLVKIQFSPYLGAIWSWSSLFMWLNKHHWKVFKCQKLPLPLIKQNIWMSVFVWCVKNNSAKSLALLCSFWEWVQHEYIYTV